MRNRVFRHMLRTRGWKYRVFLRQLKLFKYLSFAPTRGAFLENYYTLMRYLDDIVDGDHPIPPGHDNSADYISEKIRFSHSPNDPIDEADFLMLHCYQLAKKFDEDFSLETRDILESLLFDARRRNKQILYPEKKLYTHFYKMDIRGTIRATLKVFKDDPEKFVFLEALGTASRYQFDLEDLEEDLKNGYINISKEDYNRLGMTREDLSDINSAPVKKWRFEHASRGLEFIRQHHDQLKLQSFSMLQKLAFKFVYELPALKVFKEEIALNNPD